MTTSIEGPYRVYIFTAGNGPITIS
jgi:hypothetical protein